MLSNVSERTNSNKLSKTIYSIPLKSFYLDYKNQLTAQKLCPLTYIMFREEFEKILKHRYPSAQIIKRYNTYKVFNLIQSTWIDSETVVIEGLTKDST